MSIITDASQGKDLQQGDSIFVPAGHIIGKNPQDTFTHTLKLCFKTHLKPEYYVWQAEDTGTTTSNRMVSVRIYHHEIYALLDSESDS